MHFRFNNKILSSVIILVTLLLSACGDKPIGWGVLLMDDQDSKLESGTVLPVYQESEIRNIYTAGQEGSNTRYEINKWKINLYEKKQEAESFAKSYAEFANVYAITQKNGLSIREKADIQSDRVYKLREGQVLKITGRSAQTENIADHDGYWYNVLTDDGSSGYCFDLNLKIYNSKTAEAQPDSSIDTELLEQLLSKTYRPDYYTAMIRKNMIDLGRFKATYGLFFRPDEKKALYITENHNIVFDYTDIIQNSRGRFIFEGSSLQAEVRSEKRIAIYFSVNKQEYAETLEYIDNVEEYITSETDRRDLVLQHVEELDTVSSSAYGRIHFTENTGFTWTSNKRLVPNIIPESAGEKGKLYFDYLPGQQLKEEYDGVLSFAFEGIPGRGRVNFLFKLSDLGIKLVYVPANDITDNIVERESASPLVIFMSGAGE